MSGPIGLLLGLLLLSYLGNTPSTPRSQRLFGLPSGAEYLLLGFILGPAVLGVIERNWVDNFAPILAVGSAWLALVAGLDCGRIGRVEVVSRMAFGVGLTALVAAGMALTTWFALLYFTDFDEPQRRSLALGVGAVGCATTQHALRWTISGLRSRGALSAALLDMSRAGPVVPAVLLNLLQTSASDRPMAALSGFASVGVDLAIGVVLGGLAALLLGRDFRRAESWGVLLGVSLFSTGICTGLGLSSVASMFVLGLTLGLISPHRDEIRAMILPTERSAVLPVALLLGACLNPMSQSYALPLALLALLSRAALELLRGAIICVGMREARPAGILVGLSLTSAGSFTLAASAELALHLKDATGATLLAVGTVVLIAGEVVGPLMLRRALIKAGDLPDLASLTQASVHSVELT